jgi:hypothetical protein
MRGLRRRSRGQALTEFALVFPILAMTLFGIIVWGLGVFYQQQVQNAAREGARYAAIHSSEAQCPTTSNIDPGTYGPRPFSYYECDTPAAGWPQMTTFARQSVWAVDPNLVKVSACWSSYTNGTTYDWPPEDASGTYALARCTYAKVDTNPSTLSCPAPATTVADDMGSDKPGNQVSVYACFIWRPPMAGFLLIPNQVVMQAVVTEGVHHQQQLP